jgi:hypothetical protein
MQAVADDLGVDRKAINHHVSDRETLLWLTALSALAERVEGFRLSPEADWRAGCRAYAHALADGMVAAAEFAGYVRIDQSLVARVADQTERLAALLEEAGFTIEDCVRILAQIGSFCAAYAQDVIFNRLQGRRPRFDALRASLAEDADFEQHPRLARIVGAGIDTYDRRQLDLTIDTFVEGTAVLHRRRTIGER